VQRPRRAAHRRHKRDHVRPAPNNLLKVRGQAKGAIVAVGDNKARISYARHLREAGWS